jgi:hypothetical protein
MGWFGSLLTEHVTLSLCDVRDDALSNCENKISDKDCAQSEPVYHVRNSDIDESEIDVLVKPIWVLLSLDSSGTTFSYTGDEL